MLAHTTQALRIAAIMANVGLTVFVTLSALMRYVVGAPFHFTEELVGLLFLVGVVLALPDVSLRDEHIRVSLVPDQLGGTARRMVEIVGRLVTFVFTGWLLWLAFSASRDAFTRGLVTEQSEMPAWIAYAVLATSAAVMLAILGAQLAGRAPQQRRGPSAGSHE